MDGWPIPPAGDAGTGFRSRVIRVTRIPASQLKPCPKNWRMHPEYQAGAMTRMLERVGFVGAVLARELVPGDDTQLELIDGHLRRDLMGNQEVMVLVTDLTAAEAKEVLATYDQMTSLALPDNDKLRDLLTDLKAANVPLTDVGWPQFKLDEVFRQDWGTPAAAPEKDAPDEFPAVGEDIECESQCPKCGYLFSGGKKVPKVTADEPDPE